jgi:hypothetical protein
MEEVSSLPGTDPANPGKSRRRQQLTILAACVVIATALWFLRALENEYTTWVDHPVRYINQPEKMMTTNPLPQRISLEVKGLGFSILKHNWNFSKTPLTIDIKRIQSASGRRTKGFIEQVPLNLYLSDFSGQLKDLRVIAAFPDTVMFRFAVKKTRMVRVKPNFIYDPGAAVIPDSLVRISPDSISVEGPGQLLDSIMFIRTLPVRINKGDAKLNRSIELEVSDKLLSITPAEVTISLGNLN